MLKIKDDVELEDLKQYGFRLEPERSYYFKKLDNDIILSIQATKNDKLFDYKELSLETKYAALILNFDILYDLIKNDLVEKVGNKENE